MEMPRIKSWKEQVQNCKVDVAPSLREGTTPGSEYPKECFSEAFAYATGREGTQLVHGKYDPSYGGRALTDHAWVILPAGIVFDGVLQDFYRKDCYYAAGACVEEAVYTARNARAKGAEFRHSGPWHNPWDRPLLEEESDTDDEE